MICKWYGIAPSEVKALTLTELEAFEDLMVSGEPSTYEGPPVDAAARAVRRSQAILRANQGMVNGGT